MDNSAITLRNWYLLLLLWGLLFAKCFTVEYLVRLYNVPVNSALYVWALSIFMAVVASVVYAGLERSGPSDSERLRPHHRVWVGCLVCGILVSGAGLLTSFPGGFRVPAILALLLALGYGFQWSRMKDPLSLASAIGWLVGTPFLFLRNDPEALRIFALLLLALTVIPLFFQCFEKEREVKKAGKTMA